MAKKDTADLEKIITKFAKGRGELTKKERSIIQSNIDLKVDEIQNFSDVQLINALKESMPKLTKQIESTISKTNFAKRRSRPGIARGAFKGLDEELDKGAQLTESHFVKLVGDTTEEFTKKTLPKVLKARKNRAVRGIMSGLRYEELEGQTIGGMAKDRVDSPKTTAGSGAFRKFKNVDWDTLRVDIIEDLKTEHNAAITELNNKYKDSEQWVKAATQRQDVGERVSNLKIMGGESKHSAIARAAGWEGDPEEYKSQAQSVAQQLRHGTSASALLTMGGKDSTETMGHTLGVEVGNYLSDVAKEGFNVQVAGFLENLNIPATTEDISKKLSSMSGFDEGTIDKLFDVEKIAEYVGRGFDEIQNILGKFDAITSQFGFSMPRDINKKIDPSSAVIQTLGQLQVMSKNPRAMNAFMDENTINSVLQDILPEDLQSGWSTYAGMKTNAAQGKETSDNFKKITKLQSTLFSENEDYRNAIEENDILLQKMVDDIATESDVAKYDTNLLKIDDILKSDWVDRKSGDPKYFESVMRLGQKVPTYHNRTKSNKHGWYWDSRRDMGTNLGRIPKLNAAAESGLTDKEHSQEMANVMGITNDFNRLREGYFGVGAEIGEEDAAAFERLFNHEQKYSRDAAGNEEFLKRRDLDIVTAMNEGYYEEPVKIYKDSAEKPESMPFSNDTSFILNDSILNLTESLDNLNNSISNLGSVTQEATAVQEDAIKEISADSINEARQQRVDELNKDLSQVATVEDVPEPVSAPVQTVKTPEQIRNSLPTFLTPGQQGRDILNALQKEYNISPEQMRESMFAVTGSEHWEDAYAKLRMNPREVFSHALGIQPETTEEKLNRLKSSSPNTRQNYVAGEFQQMMANAQKMSLKDALDPDKDFVEIDKLIENVKKSATDIPAAVQASQIEEIKSGEINIAAEDANIVTEDKRKENPFAQMFGRKPKEWGKNMAEALDRDPQTPGFDMDRFKGDPNKFYGASTNAMFTALDMAFVRQQKYRAGQYPTGQELAADRGYQSIYEQGFKGQQYTFDLSKYSDEDRARIGNAFTEAIKNTVEPIIDEKTGELIGERATWGTSHKGDASAEAIATGRLQISTENMSPEELAKALKSGGIDVGEIQSLLKGSEQYGSVREMEASDVDIAKRFAKVKVRQQQIAGIGNTINKMRHFSVELNMSMLGLMFSALSFLGIITQGIGKLLQPLQDLQATFKGIGMAMAFGGENAKRFAKDVDPGTLIQGWMDLQGVMAGLQSMMASLSTKLLDAGLFERLDTAIGLLGDTLTKPENLQLFGDLIDKLIEAIPSAISGLEMALGIVDWINNLFEHIGLNLFGVIAMAGLFGTILLPVFAIINAAMQFLQFTVSGIILRTVAWVHQLLFAEPILSRLVGYTTAVKNNLTLASRNIMLILGAFGALSYFLGAMDTGVEQTVNIKYEGQDNQDSIGGILQWIGQNITGIYIAALAFSSILPLWSAVTALHGKYMLWKISADKAAAWLRLKEYFLNFKSSTIAQAQGATTNGILAQLLSHQIAQGIGGGLPVIGAALGVLIGIVLAWWGWTKSQEQTTNITVNSNTGEVTEKGVQKLATGGDVKRGGLFNLHAGEAVINSAATNDMVARLENIEKNTGDSAAGIGLLERAVSYLGWAGLGGDKKSTSMGGGGDGGGIFGWIMGLVAGIGNWLGNIWAGIRDFLGVPEDVGFWGWLWGGIVAWLGNPLGGTVDFIGYMWGLVRKAFSVLENVSFFTYVWDTMKSWIGADNPVVKFIDLVVAEVKKWLEIEPSEALVPTIIAGIKGWFDEKLEGDSWAKYIFDTIIGLVKGWFNVPPETDLLSFAIQKILDALFGKSDESKLPNSPHFDPEKGQSKSSSFIDTIIDRLVPDNLGSLFIDTLLDKLGINDTIKRVGGAADAGLKAGFMATIPGMGWLYASIFGKNSWSPEELNAFAGTIPPMGFLHAAFFGDGDDTEIIDGINAVGAASLEFSRYMGQIPAEFATLNSTITSEMSDMVNRQGDGLAASLRTAETAYEETTDGVVKALTNMTTETQEQMDLFVTYVQTAIAKAVAAAAAAAGANYSDLNIA
jgi:hypothetical protein